MSNLDLHDEYNASGDSIHDLFDQIEEGFVVPRYQRERWSRLSEQRCPV